MQEFLEHHNQWDGVSSALGRLERQLPFASVDKQGLATIELIAKKDFKLRSCVHFQEVIEFCDGFI